MSVFVGSSSSAANISTTISLYGLFCSSDSTIQSRHRQMNRRCSAAQSRNRTSPNNARCPSSAGPSARRTPGSRAADRWHGNTRRGNGRQKVPQFVDCRRQSRQVEGDSPQQNRTRCRADGFATLFFEPRIDPGIDWVGGSRSGSNRRNGGARGQKGPVPRRIFGNSFAAGEAGPLFDPTPNCGDFMLGEPLSFGRHPRIVSGGDPGDQFAFGSWPGTTTGPSSLPLRISEPASSRKPASCFTASVAAGTAPQEDWTSVLSVVDRLAGFAGSPPLGRTACSGGRNGGAETAKTRQSWKHPIGHSIVLQTPGVLSMAPARISPKAPDKLAVGRRRIASPSILRRLHAARKNRLC